MPRGDNRVPGFAPKKGPISQRELARILPPLIDVAAGKVSSRTRDEARAVLREILAVAHWETPFVYHNLKQRRCRFLTRMGYSIPSKWLLNLGTDASIRQWRGRQNNG